MNNTETRLEKHSKEVIIEQINICLTAEDPRYQLGSYVEMLREELIDQAVAEERERVVEMIKKGRQNIVDKYDAVGSGIENKHYWFILKVFDDLLTSLKEENKV